MQLWGGDEQEELCCWGRDEQEELCSCGNQCGLLGVRGFADSTLCHQEDHSYSLFHLASYNSVIAHYIDDRLV